MYYILASIVALLALLVTFHWSHHHCHDDGGWLQDDSLSHIHHETICGIDRVSGNLSQASFRRLYYKKKPVIITQVEKHDKSFQSIWSKDNLLSMFGKRTIHGYGMGFDIVSSGGRGYGSGGGNGDTHTSGITLEYLINHLNDSILGFDAGSWIHSIPELYQHTPIPKYFSSTFTSKASLTSGNSWLFLSLGGPRNGVPFHQHGENWFLLIYGSKLWHIYPPSSNGPPTNYDPTMDPFTWHTKVLPYLTPSERPLVCIQNQGDVIYLPAGKLSVSVSGGGEGQMVDGIFQWCYPL